MVMEVKQPKKVSVFAYLNPFRKQLVRYGLIPSETRPDTIYNVLKLSNILGTKYECECKDYFFRRHECKHIQKFKAEEQELHI